MDARDAPVTLHRSVTSLLTGDRRRGSEPPVMRTQRDKWEINCPTPGLEGPWHTLGPAAAGRMGGGGWPTAV